MQVTVAQRDLLSEHDACYTYTRQVEVLAMYNPFGWYTGTTDDDNGGYSSSVPRTLRTQCTRLPPPKRGRREWRHHLARLCYHRRTSNKNKCGCRGWVLGVFPNKTKGWLTTECRQRYLPYCVSLRKGWHTRKMREKPAKHRQETRVTPSRVLW